MDTGSLVASVLPHGAATAGTTVSAAPVVADRVVHTGLGRIDWTQASGAAADKAAQDRAAQDKANQEKAAQARADAARYHVLAQQVVQAVNEARAQPRTCGDVALPAAPPLRWNAQVAYAALLESEWMLRTNKFSHGWDDGKYVQLSASSPAAIARQPSILHALSLQAGRHGKSVFDFS